MLKRFIVVKRFRLKQLEAAETKQADLGPPARTNLLMTRINAAVHWFTGMLMGRPVPPVKPDFVKVFRISLEAIEAETCRPRLCSARFRGIDWKH